MSALPWNALVGGVLIGLGAVVLLLSHGRIAGISGITAGLMPVPNRGDRSWRLMLLLGLLSTGAIVSAFSPESFAVELTRSPPALIAAGLLVGVGTQLGNGCTSGHGVCGLSRLSARSAAATATFIGAGAVTVFVVNRWFGGVV